MHVILQRTEGDLEGGGAGAGNPAWGRSPLVHPLQAWAVDYGDSWGPRRRPEVATHHCTTHNPRNTGESERQPKKSLIWSSASCSSGREALCELLPGSKFPVTTASPLARNISQRFASPPVSCLPPSGQKIFQRQPRICKNFAFGLNSG